MTKRWFYRLQGLGGGVDNVLSMGDSFGYSDAYWAFFISCHHLREYFKNDGFTDVNTYAENLEVLRICADICNQTKHVELDKTGKYKPHEDSSIKGLGKLYGGNAVLNSIDNIPRFIIFSRFDVSSDSKTYNAFELVCDCIDAWDCYITNNNLSIPELYEEKALKFFPRYKKS